MFVGCGRPSAPANGQVSGSDFSLGAVVTFSCDPKYRIKGPARRRCGVNGWGRLPTCVRKSHRIKSLIHACFCLSVVARGHSSFLQFDCIIDLNIVMFLYHS